MKSIIFGICVGAMFATSAAAQDYGYGSNPESHYVSGYMRGNGASVGSYYQTNPNSTTYDNYGTRGNYNPYTGAYGTRSPY